MKSVTYKEWLGLPAAAVFWIVSIFCFVLGLAFENQTGYIIPGIGLDMAVLISFGLGIANTIVQIIGNDHTKEELGLVLFLGWIASYMLGIGSNVNYLYSLIAIANPLLKFLICAGLGIMVEVLPERLIVRFLRAASGKSPSQPVRQPSNISPQSQIQNMNRYTEQSKQKPKRSEVRHGQPQMPNKPPTYYPIPDEELPFVQDLPEFLVRQKQGMRHGALQR